jgi:transposase
VSNRRGSEPLPLPDGLAIPTEDWYQTPTSVQSQVLALLKRVEALEARVNRDASNASRPPSTDAPATKRQRRMQVAERRQPGATPGHPAHHQGLLEPTASVSLFPDACACGSRACAAVTLSHTHQVLA